MTAHRYTVPMVCLAQLPADAGKEDQLQQTAMLC